MKKMIVLIVVLMTAMGMSAKVKLPHVLSDGMVLQQKAEVKLWGTAKERQNVKVTTSWNNMEYVVKADAVGKWSVRVSTPEAGNT